MRVALVITFLLAACPATANDWEKFYKAYENRENLIKHSGQPELVPFSGNFEQDSKMMWRNGYVLVGASSFNSSNGNIKDAIRLAKKMGSKYVMIQTSLESSSVVSLPLTTPTTTTSQTMGSVNAYGTDGSAYGTYNSTTTTYGSQTSYIPIQMNRFDKSAAYFMEAPKSGIGVILRELTDQEVKKLETRRAFAVRWIRDGSPAYKADILPNDIFLKVNDLPADTENWQRAIRSEQPIRVKAIRNGNIREFTIDIPPEWRPK